jgi:hypothetical protein
MIGRQGNVPVSQSEHARDGTKLTQNAGMFIVICDGVIKAQKAVET